MKTFKINLFDYWEQNWKNAYRLFYCKGDLSTKEKHKKKWHDDFMKMFEEIDTIYTKCFNHLQKQNAVANKPPKKDETPELKEIKKCLRRLEELK